MSAQAQLLDGVETRRTWFSFSTRMKRSAQPFPSGSRTKAGDYRCRGADLGLEVVAHLLRALIFFLARRLTMGLAEPAEALALSLKFSGLQDLKQ